MFLGVPALLGTCRARSTVTVEDVSLRGGRCGHFEAEQSEQNRSSDQHLVVTEFTATDATGLWCGSAGLGALGWSGMVWVFKGYLLCKLVASQL